MLYHILACEQSSLLKIDNIGFSDDPRICRFGPGARDLYLIHYVISGSGTFNGNRVEEGQGFLTTPHSYENYFPSEDNPWKLLWITSRDKNIIDIFKSYNADKETQIFDYTYPTAAEELTKFIKLNHNKVYSVPKLLEIFLGLYNQNTPKETAEKMEDVYYNYALDYMKSNLFRTVRVKGLTEILGVSQPYLYKVFMKKSGVSPKQALDDLKLRKAKGLLVGTSMQISDVAYSTGFNDPLSFSKFFKKKTGISPTEYKSR